MKFFLSVLLLYIILLFTNFNLAEQTFLNFLSMVEKIIPLLFLVFAVMVVVNLFFTKEITTRYLGEKSGLLSWLYAIVAGILISGPPYVLYPMLGELKNNGMKNSLIAVMLFNRNVKIPFIPALIYYFSLKYALVFSAYIILFSILNGLLVGFFTKNDA